MNYRKEIDGLRAVAVIPVVLFHSGFGLFKGGYIGVDVFFVISGFLITSIISEQIQNKSFSILNFYERRARRILPALFFVLLISTVVSHVLLSPGLLKSYSLSLLSVLGFVSNIYFRFNNGYFSTVAEEKPLIHTWSLAIEEQFYILLPFLLVWLWFLGRKGLSTVLALVAMGSLYWAEHLATLGIHRPNFFLIFSRAWELLFGAILALNFKQNLLHKSKLKPALEVLGFGMVMSALIFFDSKTPTPSLWTLIPVIGTCLILQFSSAESLVGRLLSTGVLVKVGLISYSLYLWHQPILAFLKMKMIGPPPGYLVLLAICASFVLAYISWKFIERPFRNNQSFNRKRFYQLTVGCALLLLVTGLFGYYQQGFPHRFDTVSYAESMTSSPIRNRCHTQGRDFLPPAEACTYFGNEIKWAALGDSHMVEPAYVLAKKLEPQDIGVLHLTFSACPAALSIDLIQPPGCKKWFDQAMEVILDSSSIENVVLSFRYSYHLFGNHVKSYPQIPNKSPENNFTAEFKQQMIGDARLNYWLSLKNTLLKLKAANKNVYVIYPIPELPVHIEKAVSPYSVFNNEPLLNLAQATTADYYQQRHQYILEKLDSLEYDNQLVAIKPYDALCKNNHCAAVLEGKALYFDNNHLSLYGAQKVIDMIELNSN